MPDLPTVAESGYKDYEEDVWFGVVAPAKTPKGARLPARRLVRRGGAGAGDQGEARRPGALYGRIVRRGVRRPSAQATCRLRTYHSRGEHQVGYIARCGQSVLREEHHGQRSGRCVHRHVHFRARRSRCLVAGEDDHQDRRALPGRWQRRHHRAAARRAHHQEPGTDRRGREPPGRRGLDRLRGGGARGAGRQHAGDQRQLVRHQPACAQGQLRSAQELSADLLSALLAASDRGQQRLVPSHACRFHQDGAVTPEAAGVCDRRARNHAAYRPRAVAARGRTSTSPMCPTPAARRR